MENSRDWRAPPISPPPPTMTCAREHTVYNMYYKNNNDDDNNNDNDNKNDNDNTPAYCAIIVFADIRPSSARDKTLIIIIYCNISVWDLGQYNI